MKTIYIFKNDTTSFQEYPIPDNLDNFYEVQVEDSFIMSGLKYVPEREEFESIKVVTSKIYAKSTIDNIVHTFRLRFITSISGQETIYAAKDREAKEYLATGVIGPFLQSEMEATNTNADTCVSRIVAEATKFYALASSTEQIRRTAKIAVDNLPDPPELADVNIIINNLKISLEEISN